MINADGNKNGFVIKIDNDSEIREVIFNSLKEEQSFEQSNFTKFVEKGSLEKYFSLLNEAKDKKVVFGREINLKVNKDTESFLFIVLKNEESDKIILAANQSEGIIKYYEELMKINNSYVNNLRRNIKEQLKQKNSAADDHLYNEMSRLNNQLVNLQRELNKKNLLLKTEKEKYRVTLANIGEGVISADSNNQIVYINSQAEEMLGWTLEEAKNRNCEDVFKIYASQKDKLEIDTKKINKKEIEKSKNKISNFLSEKEEIKNEEAVLIAKNENIFPIEFSASYVKENQAKVIIFRNISERKSAEQRLKKYASTDLLTEVLNRRAGLEYLREEIEKADRNKNKLAVIFIDINDLKFVNDNFGHKEGDELLQRVSNILQQSLRRNDKVVRLGGDEFLLILPESDKKSAEKIWLRIKKKFHDATESNQKNYKISASHGAAEYNLKTNKTVDQLINQADRAMYQEKKKLKGEV